MRARLVSWRRWTLGVGPLCLTLLFLVRATTPAIDPILLGIFVVLAASTAGLIAGSRIGAVGVLVLGLALFQPTTAREFSFSLSAVDSQMWRLWAVGSLVALGWSLAAAIFVLVAARTIDRTPSVRIASAIAGGVVVGVALIAVFPALSPQPAFGRDLDSEAIAALPVIELLDFRYEPVIVEAAGAGDGGGDDDDGADGVYRARLDNPTELPHTFTVESLDLEVYVPAGRWAVLEIGADDLAVAPLAVVCTIGDHLALGMAGVIELR